MTIGATIMAVSYTHLDVYKRQDYCYVEIGIEFKEATINVYDMTGKLAYQTKTKNSVTKINTANLPQGTYIVTANTENKSVTNKIVKK